MHFGIIDFRRYFTFGLILILFLSLVLSVNPVLATSTKQEGLTAENLAAYFDEIVPAGLDTYQIPGVTVAVVADGSLVFSQGYGYADIENKIPVHPEETLFDVGSIGKLFTFTAVMQLVESGRLDLDSNVNDYLTLFKIPETYPEAVTVAHLLTHTGGFDEWDIGAAVRSADEVLPVCEYLSQRMPPRVRPPGELITYSNHGAALAGCLVEEVSGLPFGAYIEQHIFKPLGMTHSTFLWPPELMANMAVGYQRTSSGFEARDVYYRHFGPAGELKTTAKDISQFMLAHLQGGQVDGVQILKPETAKMMHSQQFTHHPLISGFTYGFFEDSFNNRRALVHGGDTNPIFSSLMVLLLEEQVGLFVAHNTAEYTFREALVSEFMMRFFPVEGSSDSPQGMKGFANRTNLFTGFYQPSFMIRETSLEKLLTAFAQFQITTDTEGLLTLHEPAQLTGEETARWIEIEPLVFKSMDYANLMVFVENEATEITYMATDRYPGAAFLPVPWYETLLFNMVLLGVCSVFFLSGILGWFRGRRNNSIVWHTIGMLSLINILFIIGLIVMLQILSLDAIFGLPIWANLLLVLPIISLALCVFGLGYLFLPFRGKKRIIKSTWHILLVLVAGLAFAWQTIHWNLTILQ